MVWWEWLIIAAGIFLIGFMWYELKHPMTSNDDDPQ